MHACATASTSEGVAMLKGFNGRSLEVNTWIIMLIFALKEVTRDKEIGKHWSVIQGKLDPLQNLLEFPCKVVYGWFIPSFSCWNNKNEIHNSHQTSQGYSPKLPFWQVWEKITKNEKSWALSYNFIWKKIIKWTPFKGKMFLGHSFFHSLWLLIFL